MSWPVFDLLEVRTFLSNGRLLCLLILEKKQYFLEFKFSNPMLVVELCQAPDTDYVTFRYYTSSEFYYKPLIT